MATSTPSPALSVVIVAGPRRQRVLRLLRQLAVQTAVERLEVVVIDLAPSRMAPAVDGADLAIRVLPPPGEATLERSRIAGYRAARGSVVAFLQEHVEVEPDWAQAVLDTFSEGAAVVGYRFRPPTHGGLQTRACFLAEYGAWSAPGPSSAADRLPGHNVAYARETLEGLGRPLDDLLTVDAVAQDAIRSAGGRLAVAGSAVATHSSCRHIGNALRAHRAYARLLAAWQLSHGSRKNWPAGRRVAFALAAPLAVPALRFARLIRDLRPYPTLLRDLVLGAPLLALLFGAEALGEILGALTGAGGAERTLTRLELTASRRREP